MAEDRRAILCADIRALSVQSGWVMACPEGFEQRVIADLRRVKDDLDGFGMAGGSGADFFVGGGVFCAAHAAHIADLRGDDARQFLECRLDTPKASGGEMCDLLTHEGSMTGISETFKCREAVAVVSSVAEGCGLRARAFEEEADIDLIGHAHAAVHLDGLIGNEARTFAQSGF